MKTTILTKKDIILGLTIIILTSLLFSKCENEKLALASINALTSEVENYKLKNGQKVTSQKVATIPIAEVEKLMDDQMREMAKKFSQITATQIATIKTSIPTTNIAFSEPITIKDIDTITNQLKFVRSGYFNSEWYDFGYKVTQDSLSVSNFTTYTKINRIDGFKRKWFLGKKTLHSDISFSNPYINIESVQTYKVAIPVKWHETRAFNIAVGFLAGAILIK